MRIEELLVQSVFNFLHENLGLRKLFRDGFQYNLLKKKKPDKPIERTYRNSTILSECGHDYSAYHINILGPRKEYRGEIFVVVYALADG